MHPPSARMAGKRPAGIRETYINLRLRCVMQIYKSYLYDTCVKLSKSGVTLGLTRIGPRQNLAER